MSNSASNRVVEIVQYGMGGVGRALLGLIANYGPNIRNQLGIELRYRALVDSTSVLHLDSKNAASGQHLQHLAGTLKAGAPARLNSQPGAVQKPSDLAVLATELDRLKGESSGARLVVVDVSGASETIMAPVVLAALRQGQRVALANKRPLCGPFDEYKQIMEAAGPGSLRLRHEATVGAALPVISTLRALLDAQDSVRQISGTFSGTLGYLTTNLEEGVPYSQAVAEAKRLGYTEPDPRDDLGGVDVARKALILARMLGSEQELKDIEIEALYPLEMSNLSVAEFMLRTPELDEEYRQRFETASQAGASLRYVATVEGGKCRVGLEQLPKDSPIGRLRGTNNMIVYRTARYGDQPVVVQGPGAGAEITASGVLSDIISLAR
ncbi:MAG TPA: homoserine dehydrogenase [Chloroflexia bacterium]|nr:homoserine dehydrogenase [Chloroflexia bacterium]